MGEVEVIEPSIEDLLQPPNINIECTVDGCKQRCATLSALHMHMGKTHGIYESDYHRHVMTGGIKGKMVAKQITKHYFCPALNCNRRREGNRPFLKLSALKLHYINIHAEKRFVCDKCKARFGSARQQMLHSSKCGQIFSCSCGTPYTTPEALYMHAKRQGHSLPTDFIHSRKYSWRRKDLEAEMRGERPSNSNSNLRHLPSTSTRHSNLTPLLPKGHCILIVPAEAVSRVSITPQTPPIKSNRKPRKKAQSKNKSNTNRKNSVVSVASQSLLSFNDNSQETPVPPLSMADVEQVQEMAVLCDLAESSIYPPNYSTCSVIGSVSANEIPSCSPWLGQRSHIYRSASQESVVQQAHCLEAGVGGSEPDVRLMQGIETETQTSSSHIAHSESQGDTQNTLSAATNDLCSLDTDDNLSSSRSIGTMFEPYGVPIQTDLSFFDLFQSCDIETQTMESIFSCDAILKETCSTQTPRLSSIQSSVETAPVMTKEAETVVGQSPHPINYSTETQTSSNHITSQTQTAIAKDLEDVLSLSDSQNQTHYELNSVCIGSSPCTQQTQTNQLTEHQETQTLRTSPSDLLSMDIYTQTVFSQVGAETFTHRDVAVSFPDLPLSDMHTQTVNDFNLDVFDISENSASVQTDFPLDPSVDSSTVAIQVASPVFDI